MTGGSARAVVGIRADKVKIKMAGAAARHTDAKMADLQRSGTVKTADAMRYAGGVEAGAGSGCAMTGAGAL